jgi:hypothetical protein
LRRPASLSGVRRFAVLSIACAGLGLFATGVRGLTQLDGDLADAAKVAPTHHVKQELDVRDDCPWQKRDQRQL